MGERTRSVLLYLALLVVIFVIGAALAIAGNVVRDPICFGGGSECNGVEPISRPIGTALYVLGSFTALTAPALAGGAWLYVRRRR